MGGHIILLAGLTIGVLVVGGALLYEEIEEQRERSRRARVASDARPQQHGNARTSARRHDIPLRKRQAPQRGSDMLDDDEPLAATQQRLVNSLTASSNRQSSVQPAPSQPQSRSEVLFDMDEPAIKPFTSRTSSPYIAAPSLPASSSTVPLIPESRPISRAALSPTSPTLSAASDYIMASVSDVGSQDGGWHDLGNETSEDEFEQVKSSGRAQGKKALA